MAWAENFNFPYLSLNLLESSNWGVPLKKTSRCHIILQVPNWSVLIRVLQPIEAELSPVIDSAETYNSQLTLSDRMKWRQIITTESTLKTLLTGLVFKHPTKADILAIDLQKQ